MAATKRFTKSQVTTLRLVSLGLSNQEIAEQLSTTVGTTKWRLHTIFTKLEVRNRTAAAAKARRLRLI
jgi:LuxR family maltose regulon positive regulatory protein